MIMNIEAKICGLSTQKSVQAAIDNGAKYVGFVFYPRSPRNVSIENAAKLAQIAGSDAFKVGVFVNPDDELLTNVLKEVDLDIIQLHGNEPLERVQYIKARFNKKVMKAISISAVGDISRAREYERKADMLLFDTKPPANLEDALPGGNGLAFDWNLIAGNEWRVPWMLSGGLNGTNVTEAIKISGAKIVDVSSGLESAPGRKEIEKIKSFMDTVKKA